MMEPALSVVKFHEIFDLKYFYFTVF